MTLIIDKNNASDFEGKALFFKILNRQTTNRHEIPITRGSITERNRNRLSLKAFTQRIKSIKIIKLESRCIKHKKIGNSFNCAIVQCTNNLQQNIVKYDLLENI